MSLNGTVLKADSRGRMRRPASQRHEIMEEFERSGVSGAEFARLSGVNYKTFCGWRYKHARQKARQPEEAGNKMVLAPKMQWVEAVVNKVVPSVPPVLPKAPNKPSLVIRFASGAHMELNDLSQTAMAAALLKALEK